MFDTEYRRSTTKTADLASAFSSPRVHYHRTLEYDHCYHTNGERRGTSFRRGVLQSRMPWRASSSKGRQYIAALVAFVAVIGYVVFDWRFGETDSVVPLVLGAICVVTAVERELYQRVY